MLKSTYDLFLILIPCITIAAPNITRRIHAADILSSPPFTERAFLILFLLFVLGFALLFLFIALSEVLPETFVCSSVSVMLFPAFSPLFMLPALFWSVLFSSALFLSVLFWSVLFLSVLYYPFFLPLIRY